MLRASALKPAGQGLGWSEEPVFGGHAAQGGLPADRDCRQRGAAARPCGPLALRMRAPRPPPPCPPFRFYLGTWNMEGFMAESRPVRTLREILARLKETYCGSIGYEVGGAGVAGEGASAGTGWLGFAGQLAGTPPAPVPYSQPAFHRGLL